MTLARLVAWMLYRLYRMSYKQICFAFVCVCGFAGIFYYIVIQSASFSVTGKPYVAVNGVVSLTGLLSSISQQQLKMSLDEQRAHTNLEESHHRKSFTHGLKISTNSTYNNAETDTIESLERFTLSRPAKDKLLKHAEHLDEKFLRNDEKSIQRIVDGLDGHQSTQVSEIFRKKGQLQKRFPTIIIVGVKKGGTRALLEMLKLHPQVCACGPEMHFFDRYYFKGLDWYRGKMPLCYENEASVEKTPSYFVTNGVAKDMFAYSKTLHHTLKLLVIVRDPTTRAISDYTQSQYKMLLNKKFPVNRSFEQSALRVAADGSKSVDSQWGAIKIGVYSKHLKRWFRYFTPEQIHVVSGEGLINKPYEEIKMVEKFLNLPSFIKREHFVYNDTKKFYCFDRSLSYKSEVVTPALPLRCLGTTKGRSHVKISEETRKLLRNYFRPFNEELYSMVGRNFGWQ